MNISIVIPVYNEVDSLRELQREIIAALHDKYDYELIFIDDGSDDCSGVMMHDLAQEHPATRVITLFRNYGKAAALAVGFQAAKGDVVITMDSDLQDNPAEIPGLVEVIESGWDLVSGWKKKRHDPISKRWPSKIFNFVVRVVSGVKIHDFNCGLKAYRGEVVKTIDIYGGLHRFIPALARYKGFKVTEQVVEHRARQHGKTKYGLARYFHGLLDLITVVFIGRYFQRPMHFFGVIGLLTMGTGLAILGYLTYNWFTGIWIGNRPIIFLGMLLLIVGIQVFSLGLLAEVFVQRRHKEEQLVKSTYDGD